jgi:hypothetical protein
MRAVVPYMGGELEASLEGERWVVRLGELEESGLYLDYALAQLLDVSAEDVHRLATQLLEVVIASSSSRR